MRTWTRAREVPSLDPPLAEKGSAAEYSRSPLLTVIERYCADVCDNAWGGETRERSIDVGSPLPVTDGRLTEVSPGAPQPLALSEGNTYAVSAVQSHVVVERLGSA